MKSSIFTKGYNVNTRFDIKKNEVVLGIACYLHDSSACFLKNGKIIYASQEERHTRVKNDNGFPFLSIIKGIEFLKLDKSQIKTIIFHESLKTLSKLRQKNIKDRLKKDLSIINLKKKKLKFLDHHLSHAAAGYFSSGFNDALIFSFDARGENVSTSIFFGKDKKIKNIKKIDNPNSIGLLYSAFTYFLGFEVNSGEYKMMGLSPYGKPIYEKKIFDNLLYLYEDGSFKINKKYFNFINDKIITTKNLEKFFGIKRRTGKEKIRKIHSDIAASIQIVVEKIIFKIIEFEIGKFHTKNIVLSGGVALNCVANGKVERYFKKRVHIFPSPGDSGNSYGCAVYATFNSAAFKYSKVSKINNIYCGADYKKDIRNIKNIGKLFNVSLIEFKNYNRIVRLLTQKKIIGFFNGRAEFGPRALGNRSIIADPRNKFAQKEINLKIKFRESFRPFAPIVLKKCAHQYFNECKDSPFMQKTYYLNKKKLIKKNKFNSDSFLGKINQVRSVVPAITHVDNSARVQTLSDNHHPLYKILLKFYSKTGCPMLINTSFNVNNEPIVESPFDAVKTFVSTNIDYLIINNYIISKK